MVPTVTGSVHVGVLAPAEVSKYPLTPCAVTPSTPEPFVYATAPAVLSPLNVIVPLEVMPVSPVIVPVAVRLPLFAIVNFATEDADAVKISCDSVWFNIANAFPYVVAFVRYSPPMFAGAVVVPTTNWDATVAA